MVYYIYLVLVHSSKFWSNSQQPLTPSCITTPYLVKRINHGQSLLLVVSCSFFPKGVMWVLVTLGVEGKQCLLEWWPPVPRCFMLSPNFLFLYSKGTRMSDQFILPRSLFVRVDLNVLVLLTILRSLSYPKSKYVSAFSFCSAKAAWFGFSGGSSIFIDIKNTHLIANLKVD